MAHQKNEFVYHKVFDNKYVEQSYIAYLTRGKKYLPRLDSWNDYDTRMNYSVVKPIDFVIRCNNVLHSRKPREENIEDIGKLYSRVFEGLISENGIVSVRYGKITDFWWDLKEKDRKNEYVVKLHQMMEDIENWEKKFKKDWDGFRDFIYDSIKYIDDNKFTYIVGENIAYPRSLSDKISKKFYCLLVGAKGYETFKKYYSGIISNKIDSDQIVNQISGLLITIGDLYNSLIAKDLDLFDEIINSYMNDNDMKNCKDIYYLRVFEDLKEFYKTKSSMTNTEKISFLKNIITNENKKYLGKFVLYENISIDESSLEDVDYFELK